MRYLKLINILAVMSIGVNALEKILSYIGQRTYPTVIFEGNIFTEPFIRNYGLEWGHIIPFFLTLLATFGIWLMAKYSMKPLEGYPKRKEIAMAIYLLMFSFLVINTAIVAYHNAYLIWINS